ncbi:SusC/RagA family TonB-linked outer membrane protein [Bacteroides faecalis]|uniref:SusC/RagA family TonB-linked outer membrane protein n=1 Tax=Bacteroides faecalis TaxID=2447885 RepID=A0A401LP60_9BACE|nr:TonB-dependent receptor [Bacteroides faecalis]GCB33326.1 SusC/RagA family TonB-linked outer membrane protein [Bacteroides faecalis]
MKKNTYILLACLLLCLSNTIKAQETSFNLTGVVTSKGELLPGVNIHIKNKPGAGVVTNLDGKYQIKVQISDVLVFSFIGYKSQEKLISQKTSKLDIELEEETGKIDEVEIVAYGKQRKVSVVGAISSINIDDLKSAPVTSMSNALAGRMAGIIGVQQSGEPGSDVSEFWIRGISTFGAKSTALFLIDGVERTQNDFNNLLPEDIESFSILKDASATAVYGARGANGVVLITTKRGKEGKMSISANVKTMIEYLPRLPKYLKAYDYANLANEAKVVRGEVPLYDDKMFEVIKYHLDDNFYPDINWQDEILKKSTFGWQANLNISGGGSIARYFMSLNYRGNDAAYKESNMHKYNTNVKRHQYSFRSNIDVNVTKSTIISLNLATTIIDMNRPGIGTTNNIWSAQANMNPLNVPKVYTNGQFPAYGKDDATSPYVLLNETGYVSEYNNTLQSTLKLNQDLGMITKGLSFEASISFDSYNYHNGERKKMPELYKAIGYSSTGKLLTEKTVEAQPIKYTPTSGGNRKVYAEARLHYERMFGWHRIGGLFLYNQSSYNTTTAKDEISSIPVRTQGIAGRLTYSYKDIYLSEFNFGYNGTENFPKGQRFGFFPSIALGWVISNYAAIQEKLPFLRLMKIRYSFGLVGNDELNQRFPFLTYVGSTDGYAFGDRGENSFGGIGITQQGSEGLQWEKAVKHNIGLDITLFDKISMEFDYFHDIRSRIFMERTQLPDIMGIPTTPYGNVGKMKNYGYDGTLSYHDKIGDNFSYELRGNFTITKNKILEYDEPNYKYSYLAKKGQSLNITYGYVALGYFRDEDDIKNSPQQFGNVMPGDIKYKDINGDNAITQEDIVPIGNSNIPRIQYGFAGNFSYKNWDLGIFFRGSGASDFFYGGQAYFPFQNGETGNILSIVNDPSNRWIPASFSGDKSTEKPNARFPRLSYGTNKNNFQQSTHWLGNSAFLRLKTIEIGYTVPNKLLHNIYMKGLRVSVIGDNLHVWDKVKIWDPEQADKNGAIYPLTRSFTLNLQASF